MMTAPNIEDRYLGDGVYASFDGYMVWLDLRGQDNTTKIALEPLVFAALVRFGADVDKYIKAAINGTYTGSRTDSATDITKDGVIFDPAPSQELFNHSPDGFNWGFGGSGPAQLALALLLDAGVEQPLLLYQKFKLEVVANWGDTWEITTEEIQEWCQT